MNVGSLFSGIGGLDLGLERAGMTVKWQSEIDPFCCEVLEKHWPGVPNLGDVTNIEWEGVERVDLICGGFPCQPFSSAGKRLGTADDRYLWPHFRTAIRALRPGYVVVENVPGLLVRGMGDVLGDLAELGYDTEWSCISAADVGAAHLRRRVFIVAWAEHRRDVADPGSGWGPGDDVHPRRNAVGRGGENVADADRAGRTITQEGETGGRVAGGWSGVDPSLGDRSRTRFERDGRGDSGWWAVEPDVGRVAHGVPRRVDRLRALGNAVVPQVAEYVGRRILAR